MTERQRLHEIWGKLTRKQRRFVAVAGDYASKKEAAEAVGLRASTVYHWGALVDEAVDLVSRDRLGAALEALEAAVIKAALIKTEGLDEGDPRLRQQAASEILDRMVGKARPRPEESNDEDYEVVVSYTDLEP